MASSQAQNACIVVESQDSGGFEILIVRGSSAWSGLLSRYLWGMGVYGACLVLGLKDSLSSQFWKKCSTLQNFLILVGFISAYIHLCFSLDL